jgi:hypothetical protein
MAALDVRRNIYDLSDAALTTFRDAVNALKASGVYDAFVHRHHEACMRLSHLSGETAQITLRNSAHGGPAFLPWHRRFLRDFERALQEAAPETGITLPYWDWAADADEFPDPKLAPLWSDAYIGGDGVGPGSRVVDGPFAGWPVLIAGSSGALAVRPGAPGLIRRLGRDCQGFRVLPTSADVEAIFTIDVYDASPWREGEPLLARNVLEGWATGPPALASPLCPAVVDITADGFVPLTWREGLDLLPRGTVVIWRNLDDAPHTVTADDGTSFASDSLASGALFRHTFATSGDFTYHDELNPALTGTVPVGPPAPDFPDGVPVTTHNLVHCWVGGDMLPPTSPNDPVFYLNHANVDRLWARWQREFPGASYDPLADGPPGHIGNEAMLDLGADGVTPVSVLDYRALGYEYDTLS